MQQQPPPPQPGGSQFGAPPSEMGPFPSSAAGTGPGRAQFLGIPTSDALPPEAASPISSRAPPAASCFDELGPAVAAGGFPDEEALAAGEEAERGGAAGNRWPRQETLALLKIRSEMDAAFRDATFKGPLWEEVSRNLAELGYKRSSKKCKEKFENVQKYYKRTKEGRAGRQDGKAYRFFDQLEALHSSSGGGAAATPTATPTPLAAASPTTFGFSTAMAGPSATRIQPLPISTVAPPPVTTPTRAVVPEPGRQGFSSSAATAAAAAAAAAGISFSSNSSSSSSSESDGEETEEAGGSREGRKRKRGRGSRYRGQMMAFFEGLMKQVMERQEAMQQRFLEAIEKREQDRMKREEAWRLQEMTRLSREQELLVQERAMAASRDTAVISYLQKISGQSIPMPAMPTAAAATVVAPLNSQPLHAAPAPPLPQQPTPPPPPPQQKHEPQRHNNQATVDVAQHQLSPATQVVPISSEPQESHGGGSYEPASSSRWPKAEVHALIKLRSGLDSRYQEAGPKGPLWEEISAGMQRLGYNRSAKRCKEKWENINKYFKKVKESNKKRPEDSKTCPYFHQLDALYRRKQSGSAAGAQQQQEPDAANRSVLEQPPSTEAQAKNGNNGNRNGGNSEPGGGQPTTTGSVQVQTSNGGHPPSFFEEGMKKPEDIVKELMEQGQQQHQGVMDDYDKMDEADSDNLDQDDDDDDEDDEDSKMQYKIQFQRPNVSGGGGGNASTTAAATAAGSFLAMVQ
ncbi:trihelix transcription factor GTL1-like isoform X1 [Canna indica]|uniref:Trihelix transcription factor GTL1-like isoform X1 n=1 Tax=Canna indica TaxID=4628 RepID=A0AAQ3KK80_9LILI|nr:trihelix transcription factor GTL1-like isoform X1 [Canna indica]